MPTKVALLPETGRRRLHVPLLADPPQGNFRTNHNFVS